MGVHFALARLRSRQSGQYRGAPFWLLGPAPCPAVVVRSTTQYEAGGLLLLYCSARWCGTDDGFAVESRCAACTRLLNLPRGKVGLLLRRSRFLFPSSSNIIDPWFRVTVPRAMLLSQLQRRWVVVNLDESRWPCGDDNSSDVVGCQHVEASTQIWWPRYGPPTGFF